MPKTSTDIKAEPVKKRLKVLDSSTCYISQSAIAIILFYGVGFGWGMQLTMPEVICAAIGVYFLEVICSYLWLRYFAYGPLEWIWRTLTYGKRLPLVKQGN